MSALGYRVKIPNSKNNNHMYMISQQTDVCWGFDGKKWEI